jgi:hypothetical protein
MFRKRRWFAFLAIPLVLAMTLVIGVERSQSANSGAVIDPSCTSANPCIEYDNLGTGPGIRGISTSGNGLAGATKNNSTSVATGREGLIGNDISTSGFFNAGVRGLSVRGNGVAGQTGTGANPGPFFLDGVFGNSAGASNSIGVEGSIGPTGGSGGTAGVQGNNNTSAIAVRANGFGGPLFVGNNSGGLNVFTVDDGGNMVNGGNATVGTIMAIGGSLVPGQSLNVNGSLLQSKGIESGGTTTGVEGNTGATSGTGGFAGIEGTNNTASTAVYANGFGGPLFKGNNSAGTDVIIMDNSGNLAIAGILTTGGSCSIGCARTPGGPGARVATYAPRESEPTMEDVGEAQLVSGQTYVRLDPAFANVIDQRASYLVFITPEGDSRGLFVTQKTISGFSVHENQGGHSTLAFSYRIVAKPYGITAPRLARMVLPAQRKVGVRVTPFVRNKMLLHYGPKNTIR